MRVCAHVFRFLLLLLLLLLFASHNFLSTYLRERFTWRVR